MKIKIDCVHFIPETMVELVPKMRRLGEAKCLIKPDEITKETHYMWCRHPLKVGPNAVIMCVPPQQFGAVWTVVKMLPPRDIITTRDATYTELAMLRLSEEYWKDFTRLDPKFAARVSPSFVESPGSFDELFKKVSVPFANNFKRDMTIILLWQQWKADWNMTYPKAVADLAVKGFQVKADALRKIRDNHSLPAFKD